MVFSKKGKRFKPQLKTELDIPITLRHFLGLQVNLEKELIEKFIFLGDKMNELETIVKVRNEIENYAIDEVPFELLLDGTICNIRDFYQQLNLNKECIIPINYSWKGIVNDKWKVDTIMESLGLLTGYYTYKVRDGILLRKTKLPKLNKYTFDKFMYYLTLWTTIFVLNTFCILVLYAMITHSYFR